MGQLPTPGTPQGLRIGSARGRDESCELDTSAGVPAPDAMFVLGDFLRLSQTGVPFPEISWGMLVCKENSRRFVIVLLPQQT